MKDGSLPGFCPPWGVESKPRADLRRVHHDRAWGARLAEVCLSRRPCYPGVQLRDGRHLFRKALSPHEGAHVPPLSVSPACDSALAAPPCGPLTRRKMGHGYVRSCMAGAVAPVFLEGVVKPAKVMRVSCACRCPCSRSLLCQQTVEPPSRLILLAIPSVSRHTTSPASVAVSYPLPRPPLTNPHPPLRIAPILDASRSRTH